MDRVALGIALPLGQNMGLKSQNRQRLKDSDQKCVYTIPHIERNIVSASRNKAELHASLQYMTNGIS